MYIPKENKLKLTIGGREHITSVAFMVPPGEDAWLEFDAGTWPVKLNIVFADDTNPNADPATSIDGRDDHAIITFTNWNNQFIGAFVRPLLIGETQNRKMYMYASGQKIGELRSLSLDFFWEAVKNG